jgi:RND superfamily putative drug exporter
MLAATGFLERTLVAGAAVTLLMLLVLLRAPVLAALVLGVTSAALWISLRLMSLAAGAGLQLMQECPLLAVALLYGAGAGTCCLFIGRFREELSKGQDTRTALAASMDGIGPALAAGASTLIAALALAIFAEFAPLRHTGPALAAATAIGVLAALTLLPALLRIVGRRVFWPRSSPAAEKSNLSRRLNMRGFRLWDSLSNGILSSPALACALAFLLITPFAIVGLRSKCAPPAPPAGTRAAITVLLESPSHWTSREGLLEIDQLTRSFAALPHVSGVASLTQPRNAADRLRHLAAIDEQSSSSWPSGKKHITRFEIALDCAASSPAAVETLEYIHAWIWKELPRTTLMPGGVRAECCGPTAGHHDLAAVVARDQMRHFVLALLAGFLAATPVVGIGFAVYLLAGLCLCYFAALGLAGSLGGVDWCVLLFSFVAVLAAGAAYGVHLAASALEEKKRYGVRDGVRRALARCGDSLTASGMILAAALVALIGNGSVAAANIGLAAAAGVLLVTFLLGPLVLPAIGLLFWYEPAARPKRKVQRRPRQIVQVAVEISDDPEADDLYKWMLDAPSQQAA